MTCRHMAGDPNCSSYPRLRERILQNEGLIVGQHDAAHFEVLQTEETGSYLVMKVRYPSCAKCSYEGDKIMVFRGVGLKAAIKWRIIDPHFREPDLEQIERVAPPPIARFPATEEGWQDALHYAFVKSECEDASPHDLRQRGR